METRWLMNRFCQCLGSLRAAGSLLREAVAPSSASSPVGDVLIVAPAVEGRVHGVRLGAGGACHVEIAGLGGSVARGVGAVVAVLGKSFYLTRKFQVPSVSTQEMRGLLDLEIEAAIPPQMGPVETSYRWLVRRDDDGSMGSYEVYIARRDALEECLAGLSAAGVEPDYLLPSAALWSRVLAASGDMDLWVARGSDGVGEAASLEPDGACSVRLLKNTEGPGADEQLIECIRLLKPRGGGSDSVVTVGWLGASAPLLSAGVAVVREAVDRLPAVGGDGAVEPLCRLGASAWAGLVADGVAGTANLLPRRRVLATRVRAVYRAMAVALVSLVASLALFQAALGIAVHRYRGLDGALSDRIARIQTEGEAVGRQIAQLEALRSARSSGDDLLNVVAALNDGTPKEISYSDVELTDSGGIRLRGQAQSVSLPFLLPESLQKQPLFHRVVLQSVGQKQQGAGSVCEFRMDGQLSAGGTGGGR